MGGGNKKPHKKIDWTYKNGDGWNHQSLWEALTFQHIKSREYLVLYHVPAVRQGTGKCWCTGRWISQLLPEHRSNSGMAKHTLIPKWIVETTQQSWLVYTQEFWMIPWEGCPQGMKFYLQESCKCSLSSWRTCPQGNSAAYVIPSCYKFTTGKTHLCRSLCPCKMMHFPALISLLERSFSFLSELKMLSGITLCLQAWNITQLFW